jgi:hypothetical protein
MLITITEMRRVQQLAKRYRDREVDGREGKTR